jgi:exopolysaccharide biosynthesis polyprenyl glycosylphosphotransferase
MASPTIMNKRVHRLKYLTLDFLSAGLSWFLFYTYRKEVVESKLYGADIPVLFDSRFLVGILSITIFWLCLYALMGYYKNVYRKSRLIELGETFIQSIVGVLLIFFIALLDDIIPSYKNYYSSLAILFSIHFSLTYFFRFVFTTQTVKRVHQRELGFKTLIVGGAKSAVDLYLNLTNSPKSAGHLIVGFVNGMDEEGYLLKEHIPYLGSYKDLEKIIQAEEVEEVIIAIERSEQNFILEEIINELEGVDVLIRVLPNTYDILAGKVKMKSMFDIPLIEIKHDLMPVWQFTFKRVMDVVVSLLAIIVLLPLYITTIILVKIGSKGPIFFYQERIGIHGKLFQIIKFRSMYVDAEKNGPQLSVDDDPRITKWGKVMRQYRIDELPQFWNVLIGDMSIVGPRPEREYYAKQIIQKAPHYKHIQKVKPGITSWGMVKFGYASTVEEMVERLKFDVIYIENMSIFNDLKVLIYTFKIVFQGRGK